MLVIESGAVPVLLEIVITNGDKVVVPTGWFPNASGAGLSTITGEIPMPLRGMPGCGLAGSDVVKIRLPARGPIAVGVNVTLIEQLLPEEIGTLHVFVCVKSPGFAPDNVTLPTARVPGPEFERVIA